MSDTTTAPTEPKAPRFATFRAKARRVLRHPVTLVTAAAAGGGVAAYAGTNKAIRDNVMETANDAVEQLTEIIENAVEES